MVQPGREQDLDDLWVSPREPRAWRTDPAPPDVLDFHRTTPGFAETPLVELGPAAGDLGRVFVKDESARLGLPSFKVLGASYAIARVLADRYGVRGHRPGLDELATLAAADRRLLLVAATDGNHGRAVARVAHLLRVPATIYVPSAIPTGAKEAIAHEGADLVELDRPYDHVVAAAAELAHTVGDDALLVQDTAWAGYERVPQWIVDGYSTMFREADRQLAALGRPADLIVVPAGVGSLAQAAVAHARGRSEGPAVVVVEPRAAPTVRSALEADRVVSIATGPTIMTGLSCGTVSSIAWPRLREGLDAAVLVGEEDVRAAVDDLRTAGVDAGPCGAATLAGLRTLSARQPRLRLPPDPHVLLLSTEGSRANPEESERP